MSDETQAAELARQDDAFQAEVDATTQQIEDHTQVLLTVVGVNDDTREQFRLEVERALWDFAATWTALLEEHNNPEQLEEQAQP